MSSQRKVTGQPGDSGSRGSRVAIETERAGPAGVGAEGTRPPGGPCGHVLGPAEGLWI